MKNIGGVWCLSVVLLLLWGMSSVWADIITVDDDGVADFNNVQAAINDANEGDTVLVQPGNYYEKVDFLGKD
ncbi:MAG: hypothetical protein ACYSWP_17520, partial [Planctomycetota bacterium]